MDRRLLDLPLPEPIVDVLTRLRSHGHEAFLVGGAVRDRLLGRETHEYDLAANARPEAIAALFPRVIETGLQHGTVTVVHGGVPLEITTYRGAVDTIEADLAHRDFTVNAMAFDPIGGRFLDLFGGVEDLRSRRIRAVGVPAERLAEDPLRAMRAARFASVLGFRLSREVRAAIPSIHHRFPSIAVERIQRELTKILVGPRPRYGIELLRRTGLLAFILPELLEGFGMRQNRWHRYDVYHHVLRCVDAAEPSLPVRLATLLHDIDKPVTAAPKDDGQLSFYNHEVSGAERAKAIAQRLRYPNKVIDQVAILVREHQFVYSDEWSDGAVRRMMSRVGSENLAPLLAVRRADIVGRGRFVDEGLENVDALERRIASLQEKAVALSTRDLALGGREVMEILGIGPSPRVGQAMGHLLSLVLDDPSKNTLETLSEALQAWWRERDAGC